LDLAYPLNPAPTDPFIRVLEKRDSTTFYPLDVIAFVEPLRPIMVSACDANPPDNCVYSISFVVFEPGTRVSVVDAILLDMIGEKRVSAPLDTLSVGRSGLGYGLDRSHRKIYLFDPNNPSPAPDRIIEIQ
jgi:hypothetical protein